VVGEYFCTLRTRRKFDDYPDESQCIEFLIGVCAFTRLETLDLMQEVEMKKVLISIFLGALLLGVAAAQDSATPGSVPPTSPPQTSTPSQPQAQPAPEQQPTTQPSPDARPQPRSPQSPTSSQTGAPTRVAPGSVIPVTLAKTIDAKKAKTGDEVVAKVTEDLKTNSGEVLIPKDTKVIGHVTEAQPRTKEQKESQVGIAFDRAVPKNGSEMPMPMSIQAIIGPQNDQNNAAGGSSDSPSGGAYPTSGGGGRPGVSGSAPGRSQPASAGGDTPGNSQAGSNTRPPITGATQGVVGIADLKLTTAAANPSDGSVVSSGKNNVKLESGTMMLLRVNQ
jgi:hypothetical protein